MNKKKNRSRSFTTHNSSSFSSFPFSFFFSSLLLMFALALFLPAVSALQVTPALQERYYTPGLTEEFQFMVTNDADGPRRIDINLEGLLAEYATLSAKRVELSAGASTTVTVRLTQPEGLVKPGPEDLYVTFRERSPGGATIGAATELAPAIRIHVPYDGAYIELAWNVQEGRDPLKVTVMARNLGDAATPVTPRLTLGDKEVDGEVLTTIGQSQEVHPGETKKFTLNIPDGTQTEELPEELPFSPGVYTLRLLLENDGPPVTAEREVLFGTPEFAVENVTLSRFTPGEIGRLTIDARLDWNKALNVTVAGTVTEESTGRSWKLLPDQALYEPGELTETELIWESQGASYGNYTLELTFTNPQITGSSSARFALEERGTGVLATASGRSGIVALLVIALVLLVTFLYLLRRERRR